MIRETIRTFRLGTKSLMLHKLRSSLTTLGLLFGVSSVIAMLAEPTPWAPSMSSTPTPTPSAAP